MFEKEKCTTPLGAGPRRLCQEDRPERLLAELAVQDLDVVLADAPAGPGAKVRVFHHPLGECGVAFFAAPRLAAAYRRRFPRSLDGAPFLLPGDGSPMRAALERWFADSGVRTRIFGEFNDRSLLKVFGQSGGGVFAAPSAIGRTEEVRERVYAITPTRSSRIRPSSPSARWLATGSSPNRRHASMRTTRAPS